ncbi:transcriptional regulator FtrA [Roseococcus suduntuyensis]|uniref:AraC family transcriptional activator FtrA n=1 Tax=Roseococcus suduntuyensis TaxID=455361 RepID=A0A840AAL4_9PROT|nr:transcriptional regulator FtrA [Roseococcus suduntuyensis]MBB3898569.1 AraC family transcriptional activator FtrA [Roseococcus suduntuyensis]
MPKRPRPGPPANRLVVAVAYDGLCTFEFGCAVEVFGLPRPEMGEGWYRFAVAAAEPGPLRAAGGVRVLVDGGAELIGQAGTIIIPGWRGPAEPVPEGLCAALRAAHAKGARILSLCSGVFVLAAAGLLEGRRATTHWRYFDALAARNPGLRVVPDVLYVDEGDVLTAAGSAAGLDLCLHLIRRDFGPAAANSVAERLVVPAHRDGDRAQRLRRPVPRERAGGSRLAATLDRVRATLAEAWPIARLAEEAATSPRGLHRRFQEAVGLPPGEWLLAERVARARDLLETTTLPVEEVARLVGFSDVQVLRRHLRRQTGLSPTAYRARLRRDADPATAA